MGLSVVSFPFLSGRWNFCPAGRPSLAVGSATVKQNKWKFQWFCHDCIGRIQIWPIGEKYPRVKEQKEWNLTDKRNETGNWARSISLRVLELPFLPPVIRYAFLVFPHRYRLLSVWLRLPAGRWGIRPKWGQVPRCYRLVAAGQKGSSGTGWWK